METHFKVTNPDKVKLTLIVTADLKDWKELKAQLKNEYPSWKLGEEISEMIAEVDKHFYPSA